MAAAGDDDSRRYAARISLTNKQQATAERTKEGETGRSEGIACNAYRALARHYPEKP